MTTRAFPYKDKYGDPRWTGACDTDRAYTERRGRGQAGSCAGQSGQWVIEVMARYIDEILQPGERVLYSTNAHWIFYVPAILAWIVALALFVLSRQTIVEGLVLLCLVASGLVALAALYWTVKGWFHRFTTETDVTNLRIVHKTGFIKRRTFEMALDKVESVDVDQTILGRILNYGDVTIRGVGEGIETIRTIASPLAFRSSITTR
jgi:Bacterial PH domain